MRIAFLDVIHTTHGAHANTVPLGIGLIATYVRKNVSELLDIKLFKETSKVLETFKFWVPDVVGITQYSWNSELNLYLAHIAKQINPNCLIVVGGPNLHMEVGQRVAYLQEHSFVDLCVAYDGEISFLEIIKRVLKKEGIHSLRTVSPAGTYCLNPHSFKYVEAPDPPPRLKSLDVFGPVYAEGVFDEFLEAGYHPFTQTHRGCPFSCAYCRTSDPYNSRMLFQSPEIFKQDMEYLGKRFAGRTDVILYIANTNMSLFEQDFPIARIIRDIQERYHWPKYLNFDTGKDPKKLLKMLSIIKFMPAPAIQTLTPGVLENIKRKNLPFDDYVDLQQKLMRRSEEGPATELILCLPGETKRTFLQTIKKVMNSGVQNLVVYTLMKLNGTPIATKEFSEKFKFVSRCRIVPRQFSAVNSRKILDIEEVIVETKDMSFEDYLELRGLCFTIAIFFSSAELAPLKRFLLEHNVDLAQWIFNIHQRLKNIPDVQSGYRNFLQETKDELFFTREDLLEFYEKEENFKDLISGKKGDNLLRKYKCLVLSSTYLTCLKLAVSEARQLLYQTGLNIEVDKLLDDLTVYLAMRDLRCVLKGGNDRISVGIHLKYDIPRWLKSTNKSRSLENFEGLYNYTVAFNDEQKKMLKNLDTHKDSTLSLQVLYRDGHSRDLWPTWNLIGASAPL